MADSTPPKLQAPGAGLPWIELLVAKYLIFPRACRKLTWASAAQQFQDEGAKVLAMWDATPAEKLGERVLVRRIAGMEDSSRHWSVAMTVEHLTMVGSGIRGVIGQLRRGEVPNATARTADFKPKGTAPHPEVHAAFVQLLADATASTQAEPPIPRGVGPRFPQPWFGPLDAHQWHCLLGFHQGIHRHQIERIRAGLGLA
ncbi:MAG: hypothetical protein U0792_12930 [Gemmataceae bacterium]